MQKWQDLFDAIEFEANKGTLFKQIIPEKVFQALRQIEQNWTYRWMEKIAELDIDPAGDDPRVITLPAGLKLIRALKLDSNPLDELRPEEFDPLATGTPTGYFRQGNRVIWLSSKPEAGGHISLVYDKFTMQEELDPEAWHPILEHGGAALIATTMMLLAPTAREPSWLELYSSQATQGIHTLHVWDEESRIADNEVIFGGGSGE